MINLMQSFLDSSAFIPHGHCYLWNPELVGLHVLSDVSIALAYYSIPLTLFYFVRRRQDLPFDWIFLLFATFITACGTTHLLEVWTLWHPTYWLSGAVKGITAIVSLYTAMMMVTLVPKALALPSPAQMEAANRELRREIGERQQAEILLRQSEAALQQNEARYRAIMETQTELICRFLPDGTLTFVNSAYCRYFEQTREDLIRQSYLPIALEEDLAKVNGQLSQLNQDHPIRTITTQVIRPNGIRTQEWIVQAICNQQGNTIELQAVGRDITDLKQIEASLQQVNQELFREIAERKRVEANLRESESRFQTFMNNNPAASWITDAEGRVIYLSSNYLCTFQVLTAEPIGKTVFDLFPVEVAQPLFENIQMVAETHQTLEAIENVPKTDGVIGEFLIYKFPMFSSSRQCLVGGIAVDITERKQMETALQESEERLQLALEASGDGLWDWNLATGEVYYSPRYLEMLGYEADEFPQVLSTWEGLVHPEDWDRINTILRIHLSDHAVPYKVDYRLLTKVGEWKWISAYGRVVVRNEQGKPQRMLGITRDISDRKQTEEALRQSEVKNRAMLAAIPDLLLRVKRNGSCLDFIPPTDSDSGLFIPIERHLSEVLPLDLLQHQLHHIELALATGELQVWEHQLMKGDRLYDEEIRLVPCGEDEVLVIVRDITQRRQAEEELRRYERIVSATTDAISLVDRNYVYQMVNQSYLLWHQKPYDEIVGHSVSDVLGQEVFQSTIKQRLDQCLSGQSVQYEMWFDYFPIGARFLSITYVPYFDIDQTITGTVVSIRDITGLKQAEQQLELQSIIVRNMAEGVCLIRATDGVIVYTNPKFNRMFGYDSEELTGEHVAILNYEDIHTNAQAVASSIMSEIIGWGEFTYDIHNIKKDGTPFWCRATSSLFEHPEHGRVIVAVQQDITEQRQAEEQIKASLKEKEILLKEIHHRVKNNLQIIYSILRLQRRSLKDPRAAASLLDSQNRIESIALIHEKLYQTGNLAQVDFSEYIPGIVSNLISSYSTPSKNIELNIEVEPIFLDIDKAIPCGLIINELISNSLKHAFSGDQTGQVQIGFHGDEHCNITLVVKDDGIGLPGDLNIAQAETLGLQLVQDFVDQLKGNSQIDRRHGTEFRITFPGGEM
jgi:PAS domain S-box-containing protein